MAQLGAGGELRVGDNFIHESIVSRLFKGRVEQTAMVGNFNAIVPFTEGWPYIEGREKILIDSRDPYAYGFQVKW